MKKTRIVLWDEFDLKKDMKRKMAYLVGLSRKPSQDKAAQKIVTPQGLVSPGQKGTN